MASVPPQPAPSPDDRQAGRLDAVQVRAMFDRIAGVYDLMNSAMTAGLHHAWRSRAADLAQVGPGSHVLDVATGTGDLALELARGGAEVTGTDFCAPMIKPAPAKAARTGLRVRFAVADALALPFGDGEFDAATIAFGIRNVPRIEAALREAYRVLRIGGRFLCLEFSTVDVPGLDAFYDFYSFNVIPALGRTVVGDAEAYRYLVESIRRFPPPHVFAEMMRAAGFARVSFQRMSGGIVALHSGWRL
jgi:demethylmenaquinone methyltransferase/2-methoxy-6-polyprenyl-1,4-benzoquinol methylase